MADYPQNLVRLHRLANGEAVTVRPIRPEDVELEQDFVRHLSQDTRYFRFMVQLQELSASKLRYFTEIDYDRHLALIAVVIKDAVEIEIAVARYVGLAQADRCEFAIAVDDAWQGSGVASILMDVLMDAARERGFKTIEGTVLSTNQRMLAFVRKLGFAVYFDPDEAGTLRIARPL